MVQDQLLAVLLTVLFGGSGLFLIVEGGRSPSLRGRIDAATHVLMCVAMIAMVWPWGVSWPAAPQVVVFSLAAVWFVGQLWVGGRGSSLHAHGGGPFRVAALLYHAVMMLATVWMVEAMPTLMITSSVAVRATSTPATSSSGMDMPGMDAPGAVVSISGFSHGFAMASGWVLLVVFAAASALLVVLLVRQTVFRLSQGAVPSGSEPASTDPLGSSTLTLDRRTQSVGIAVMLSETSMAVGMLAMVLVMIG